MDTSSPLKITELVLRDAHQSLLATRMRTEDMLPIGEKLDQVGFFSLEMWGGATFDSCLRFLNEDPWERARKLKKVIPNTPFQMLLRGQNCVGYRHYADDIVERFVKKSVDVGINIFRIFDALNDLRNIETAIKTVNKCGETVEGCISYTVSPYHSTELYIKMARQLVDMGSDIICIKDMAGLLTPEVTKTLIREIKNSVDAPVHLHTHATTGLVGMNLQAAIEAGVDMVDTAISSLSMGTGHYPTECIVAAQKDLPRDTGLDLNLLEEISNYFREVRKNYAEFESNFKGVDINILKSQIPGGMISNMENQLKEQNALDKLEDVLLEIPRVRKDMGYPPLVTPTSQIVGSQATLNILTGERYKLITKETRECVLGKYGKLPASLDPDLLAKVTKDGEVIDCRPADLLEPEWDQVAKDCKGKCTTEEDMLSYAIFPKVALEFFKNRELGFPSNQKTQTPIQKPSTTPSTPATPIAGNATYTVNVNGQAFSVQVSAGGAPPQQVLSATAPAVSATPAANGTSVTSPLPGSVFSLKVAVGDQVNEGDVVIIIESMKMETEIHASASGTINSIQVQEGQKVNTDDNLLIIG
ncbi:MAG TPA: oxaloacetate decarboxylase subunit alpha [Nitrospinaceae bacterium]|nr:oxaloacetate decarboxylase subunit alpha [Nitrospinaceae bacterium]